MRADLFSYKIDGTSWLPAAGKSTLSAAEDRRAWRRRPDELLGQAGGAGAATVGGAEAVVVAGAGMRAAGGRAQMRAPVGEVGSRRAGGGARAEGRRQRSWGKGAPVGGARAEADARRRRTAGGGVLVRSHRETKREMGQDFFYGKIIIG